MRSAFKLSVLILIGAALLGSLATAAEPGKEAVVKRVVGPCQGGNKPSVGCKTCQHCAYCGPKRHPGGTCAVCAPAKR